MSPQSSNHPMAFTYLSPICQTIPPNNVLATLGQNLLVSTGASLGHPPLQAPKREVGLRSRGDLAQQARPRGVGRPWRLSVVGHGWC